MTQVQRKQNKKVLQRGLYPLCKLFFEEKCYMVNKRDIFINGKKYEVEDIENYVKSPDAYISGYTALDVGQQFIYPIIPNNSTAPGIHVKPNCPILYVTDPPEEDKDQYDRSNIIDYNKADTFKDFIETQNMVRELEKDILTSPDNIYVPPEDENDSPAMKALKKAITDKHIDLDKYETRFGSNYSNDKRIFNKNNISMQMLVRMCNATDIKASLTLEDQNPDVANPMGSTITVELTSGNNEDSE